VLQPSVNWHDQNPSWGSGTQLLLREEGVGLGRGRRLSRNREGKRLAKKSAVGIQLDMRRPARKVVKGGGGKQRGACAEDLPGKLKQERNER